MTKLTCQSTCSPGRSGSYESDGEMRHLGTNITMDGKRSDHEIKSNLCDYSDEDDERLDIDDDSSPIPGSSRHKIEGNNSFHVYSGLSFLLSALLAVNYHFSFSL